MTNGNPGKGWSNGDIPPLLTPHTRKGQIVLYSHHRRWINYKSSWSRIGSRRSSLDRGDHVESHSGERSVLDTKEESFIMKSLIAQLCEKFYELNWATGTGGGCCIRVGGPEENRPWRVFVAPSGLQKEDIIGEDVFELDMDQNIVVPPKTPNMKLSACTPIWFVVFRYRPKVKCVIHTHSMHAQMVTMLDDSSDVLRITHLEMLKGVGGHAYDDILEVPILDNQPTEDLLADQLETMMHRYPKTNCVLVRRHGIYVWGDTWEQAKTRCESFDYLFESCIKMRQLGIDFSVKPQETSYRAPSNGHKRKIPEFNQNGKKLKMSRRLTSMSDCVPVDVTPEFNAQEAMSNSKDLKCFTIPLLPLHSKILLLDIEGCTTSISFVKETLFPYVLEHLDKYFEEIEEEEVDDIYIELEDDIEKLTNEKAKLECKSLKMHDCLLKVKEVVKIMMKYDIKATGLKTLQGNMWKAGYENKSIHGHVYPDFPLLLEWCRSQSIQVNIYSSGSIEAQKLLFGNTSKGDLTPFIHSYFDTTIGNKIESNSYYNICKKLGTEIQNIVFVSDAEKELVAARQAGMKNVVMSVRPGNAPVTSVGNEFPKVFSLLQLCGA